MRSILLAVLGTAALSFAALAGCTKDKEAAAENEQDKLVRMTVDEVDAALQAKKAIAVDCNGDHTRKKMGVLPGAIIVSDEDSFAASEMPADKATKLVFYCANSG
jgi:hypothetical protein